MRNIMKKVIWVAGLCSLGLVACGDSSSSPSAQKGQDYCKIVSSEPLVLETVEEGVYSKSSFEYTDGYLVEKVEFDDRSIAKYACNAYKSDSDYGKVECNGKTVVAYSDESLTKNEYKHLLSMFVSMCKEVGESVDESSNGDSREEGQISEPKSSSSAESYQSGPSDYFESSSSVAGEILSSAEVNADDSISWYDRAWYKKESVVASNAAELRCTETHEPEDLSKYDVAYEFDDPTDLGRDYFGKNNAYIDNKVTPVEAECGSLVLNGSNGLLIPLDDVFKSKGFVVEVRFMATAEGNMGNIFVAEPPGSGVDGWQIRLDGSNLTFHYRDADDTSKDWTVERVGEITLNEWHVINVSIGGTPGSSTLYLSISLDGDPRVDAIAHGDISNIKYGLGIGYDSMYQGLHDQRFFTGKIDYIRYEKASE